MSTGFELQEAENSLFGENKIKMTFIESISQSPAPFHAPL